MATWESKGSILPPLSHLPGGNCWAPEGILSEEGHHMRRRAEGSQQASPSWVLAAFGTRVSQSSAMLTLAEGAICRIKALGSGSTPSGWSCCRGETCPRGSQLLLCPLSDWYHSTLPAMRPEPPLFFAHPSPRPCSTITKATFLACVLPWQVVGLRLRSIVAGTRLPVP